VLDTYGSAIIQKYIEGQEITVSILEIDGVPTVLPILELRPRREFYDYIAKYTPGMTEFVLPAEIPDDATRMVKETALRIYRYLECRDMARVDGIYSDGIFYFLEVNTIPGMTELSDLPASAKAMGMSFEDVVSCVVRSALRRKEVRKWKSSMELP
ncbi:MAG: D-alanine--D-alanine ligase, partial [Thermotogae bacterium]|nr:D-alanine--D-alanine ligase [Thermotogota bacterium]